MAANVAYLIATNSTPFVDDSLSGAGQRFYLVVRQP
jgi:hypothetical protein